MTTTERRNGVDVGALFGALDAVKAQPEAAKFQFRATNEWVSGVHSRSTIHGFFGLGAEQTHKEAHTFHADHPEQLVGTDTHHRRPSICSMPWRRASRPESATSPPLGGSNSGGWSRR
jgi:hypothetical protein